MLDDTDFQILNLLSRNGRASFASLGEAVGLSPHGAADRVRRLERAGVITGYAALVDLPKVGRSIDAFVDVRLMPNAEPDQFEAFCAALPAVQEVAFVTGRYDYHVRVACHSADELDQTVRTIRRRGGAAQTETRIVLRKADPDRHVSPERTPAP